MSQPIEGFDSKSAGTSAMAAWVPAGVSINTQPLTSTPHCRHFPQFGRAAESSERAFLFDITS